MSVLTSRTHKNPLRSETQTRAIPNPYQYMLDKGMLFEWNRSYLHPCGHAARIATDDKGELYLVLEDHTDNPVVTFDEATFNNGQVKWKRWWNGTGKFVHRIREQLLGFQTQQFGDIRQHKNA